MKIRVNFRYLAEFVLGPEEVQHGLYKIKIKIKISFQTHYFISEDFATYEVTESNSVGSDRPWMI